MNIFLNKDTKKEFKKYLNERKNINQEIEKNYIIENEAASAIMSMADHSLYDPKKLLELETKKINAFKEIDRLKKILKSEPNPLFYYIKLLREK